MFAPSYIPSFLPFLFPFISFLTFSLKNVGISGRTFLSARNTPQGSNLYYLKSNLFSSDINSLHYHQILFADMQIFSNHSSPCRFQLALCCFQDKVQILQHGKQLPCSSLTPTHPVASFSTNLRLFLVLKGPNICDFLNVS